MLLRTLFLVLFCSLFSIDTFGQNKKEAEKIYKKAIIAFEKADFEKGYQLINQALALDSLNRDALYAKAFFQLEQSRFKEAENMFSKILGIYPKDTSSYLGRGEARIGTKKFADAEKDLVQAYELDSTKVETYLQLAYLYIQTDMPKDADEYLDYALEVSPEHPDAYHLKAYNYWTRKSLEDATVYIQKSLAIQPKNIPALKTKAFILFDREKYQETIKTFEQIKKINDEVFIENDFYVWAMAHYRLKNYQKALYLLETPKSPESWELFYGLAKTYYQLKKPEKALEALQKSLKIAEKEQEATPEMYYDKAILEVQNQNIQQAKEDYLQAILQMPELIFQKNESEKTADVLANADKLLEKQFTKAEKDSLMVLGWQERTLNQLLQDDHEKALLTIQKALATDSLHSRSYTIRALVYTFLKKPEKAEKDFMKAEKMPKNRDIAYIYFMKGLAYAELRQYSPALQYLDKAIEINPKNAQYYAEKASIHYEAGNLKEALKEVQKAIEIDQKEMQFLKEKLLYLYQDDQFDTCMQECNRIILLTDDLPEAFYYRGLIFNQRKEYAKAKKDLQEVLEFYPDDEDVKDILDEIEDKIKKP